MLKSIVLYARNVAKAVAFYRDGLGMAVTRVVSATSSSTASGDDGRDAYADWTEAVLETADSIPLVIHRAQQEACYSTGASPLLAFRVDRLDTVLPDLIRRGAFMDGRVHYDDHGESVRLRAPDGHMIVLYQVHRDGGHPASTRDPAASDSRPTPAHPASAAAVDSAVTSDRSTARGPAAMERR
jgi:catechol 2,3-dioxygenase-like lactoylglutathione lyase family enzyme